MTTILHISDTHFGTEQQPVLEAMEAHVRDQGVDLLVLSGDITQRARRSQFAAARAFLERLKRCGVRETLVIPGNHDLPLHNLLARFLWPYDNYRRYIGGDLEPVFETDDLLVVGLNTTHPKRRKDGRVLPEQVDYVCDRLRRTHRDKWRILVAHQPFGGMRADDYRNLQHGAHEALTRWAEAGLDMVMGGHNHRPYVLPLSQQYPHLEREIWIVQAGTALSTRLRGQAPNSFNRIHLERGAADPVAVTRWDFHGASGQFWPAAHHALPWPADRIDIRTRPAAVPAKGRTAQGVLTSAPSRRSSSWILPFSGS